MNNYIDNFCVGPDSKENLIKNNIISRLNETVKDIQLCGMEGSISGGAVTMVDAANNLCSVIEAMFLHGLKDSFARKARRVIGNDVDQQPELSFWSPLLIISHSEIINQITELSNITTEIGQCRAWVRMALNDSFLSSYLMSIIQDIKSLKPFYKSHSYICDADLLDVAHKLIVSIEICNVFTLPYNSSVLNNWPLSTLMMAGVWFSLRHCPITSGIDVAESLGTSTLKKVVNKNSSNLKVSVVSQSSGLKQVVALNEDEALKIILANTSHESTVTVQTDNMLENIKIRCPEEKIQQNRIDYICKEASGVGNSLNTKSGWSFDDTQSQTSYSPQVNPNINIDKTKPTEHSYHALIESYNMGGGSYNKIPDLQELCQYFSDASESYIESCEKKVLHQSVINVKKEMNFNFMLALEKSELNSFFLQIGKVAQEKGLDNQNYECCGCKHPLAINLSKPRMCTFTGDCYCDSCMCSEPIMIPAKIIHNWDFKKYYVSKKAASFLNDTKNHPILDLKILNPHIYKGVEEMAKIESLRIQLNFLRDYIFTCREPVITQFQNLVWPSEYIYKHIHQYSTSDFFQMPDGIIVQHLQKLVNFAREHVIRCWLCSQKGFVCEVCNDPKIVYPFDVDSTYRCEICYAVYHIGCIDSSKPCPKCERHQKREDISLLNAVLG